MSVENPTGGDTGASITERLENFLSAGDSPEPQREAPEQGSDAAPAAAAQADTTVDQPDEDGQGDDQGPQVSTADLARLFGADESALDVDADGSVLIRTKIDGKEGTAKFADVLKSYQMQGHIDNKAREVAAQHQALQQQVQQGQQAIQQRLDTLDNLVVVANNELSREFQSIDWAYLRETNPGEYSARLTDFQARKAQIDQADQQKNAERQQLSTQRAQQQQFHLQQEAALLPKLIPEWRDPVVADRERKEMLDWGVKAGLSIESIDQATHTSAGVVAMRKAMLFDRAQGSKAAVENKVRTAPKLVKAGQAQAVSREQSNVRTLKNNIRNSGGKAGDVAAYLLAAGKV